MIHFMGNIAVCATGVDRVIYLKVKQMPAWPDLARPVATVHNLVHIECRLASATVQN